jgi:DNA-binding GntR family transcriptional regulator
VRKEHREVLDAIAVRDAAGAARAMAEPIENARRRMFEGAAIEGE